MGEASGWNKVKDHKREQDVRQDRSEYFSKGHSPKILFVQLGFRLLRLVVIQRWLFIGHPGNHYPAAGRGPPTVCRRKFDAAERLS